jgi:nucleoside 2-deoxyribosyltransferase
VKKEVKKKSETGSRKKKMKVIYIAGPYRAETVRGVVENIRLAESAALSIWRNGHVAICPHLNTALFDGACPDDVWLAGDLEILKRCDAVLLVGRWEQSKGTQAEIAFAAKNNIPVFWDYVEVVDWADGKKGRGA